MATIILFCLLIADLFGSWYIKQFEKSCTPFKKTICNDIKSKLTDWAESHNFALSTSTENMRNRGKKVVAKTLHHAGIVVPYDKKTELGYRPLSETQSKLKPYLLFFIGVNAFGLIHTLLLSESCIEIPSIFLIFLSNSLLSIFSSSDSGRESHKIVFLEF